MNIKILDLRIEMEARLYSDRIPGRKFPAGLGALGAVAALSGLFLYALMPTAALSRPCRIDIHNHFSTPGFIVAIAARHTNPRPLEEWTAGKSIEDMDKGGVATSFLSATEPIVWFGDSLATRKLACECSELGVRPMADHPGGFRMACYTKCGNFITILRA